MHHLFCSTAQVENRRGWPLEAVALLVDDATLELGKFSPGQTRFVLLPKRGDANFRVRYTAGGGEFTQCSEYVKGELYHVHVAIEPSLLADCHAELRIVSRRFVLWALLH